MTDTYSARNRTERHLLHRAAGPLSPGKRQPTDVSIHCRRSVDGRQNRTGMALLVVLVLIVMMSIGAYSFTFTMESQYRLAQLHEDQVHARSAALSGIELVAAILEQPVESRAQWSELNNNPEIFRGVEFESSEAEGSRSSSVTTWRASILSPRISEASENAGNFSANRAEDASSFNFGLQNESAKIHLPTLATWDRQQPGYGRQVLMSLPGASPTVVDAILAMISAAGESRETGAGTAEMAQRTDSIGSGLNQVGIGSTQSRSSGKSFRRVWPAWLGQDLNQNYALDPIESSLGTLIDADANRVSANGDAGTTSLNESFESTNPAETEASGLALQHYLTWESGGRNENAAGRKRVYLNQQNLQELHRQLMEIWPGEWANFVIAYRQFGGQMNSPLRTQEIGGTAVNNNDIEASDMIPDFSIAGGLFIRSPLELVQTWVTIPGDSGNGSSGSENRRLLSPFRDEISPPGNYLSKLLDDVTTEPTDSFQGRIDVNDAPAIVLAAIPGVGRELAQQIVQRRSSGRESAGSSEESAGNTIARLLEEGVVDLPRLIQLEPYLTDRSDVYSCQVVGFRDDVHAVYRCTVTVDARKRPATIRNFRIWHPWDRGFESSVLSGDQMASSPAGQ
jgi:hypothetical protein